MGITTSSSPRCFLTSQRTPLAFLASFALFIDRLKCPRERSCNLMKSMQSEYPVSPSAARVEFARRYARPNASAGRTAFFSLKTATALSKLHPLSARHISE